MYVSFSFFKKESHSFEVRGLAHEGKRRGWKKDPRERIGTIGELRGSSTWGVAPHTRRVLKGVMKSCVLQAGAERGYQGRTGALFCRTARALYVPGPPSAHRYARARCLRRQNMGSSLVEFSNEERVAGKAETGDGDRHARRCDGDEPAGRTSFEQVLADLRCQHASHGVAPAAI